MNSRIRRLTDLDEIAKLLAACELPVADVAPGAHLAFFGIHQGASLVAVVGLETCPPAALLRSLAVATDARGQGLGKKLVAFAERQAREAGVKRLYLLTTTAADFFSKLGYAAADRADAPPAIRETAEFAGLCPATSAFMVKNLA